MLRLIVLLLVLLNSVYFAWSNGLLRDIGFAPEQQTEPQRVARQIRPEALRLLTAQQLREAQAAAARAAAEILQNGPADAAP